MKGDEENRSSCTSAKKTCKARCRSISSTRPSSPKRRSWSLCLYEILSSFVRFGCYLFMALVLAILISSFLNFLMGIENPVSVFLPSDEFGLKHTNLWKKPTGAGGLNLVIENALDARWTPYFDEYVARWDAGYDTIDPLSLHVERVEHDSACEASVGRLKVCNGNYGETGWRGINIALTDQDNLIRHSIAKFNDYYVDLSGNKWKRIKYSDFWGRIEEESHLKYTMCHELGHGFGLPHSDENMFNLNTGECMDYTKFPRRNLSPGIRNFDILYTLYGSSSSSRRSLRHRIVERSLSKQTMDEYQQAFESASEDSSCLDCRIPLSDGFQVTINKLPVTFALDPKELP